MSERSGTVFILPFAAARIRQVEAKLILCAKTCWAQPLTGPFRKRRFLFGSTAFFLFASAEASKLGKLQKIAGKPIFGRTQMLMHQDAYVAQQLQAYKQHGTFGPPYGSKPH